MQAPVVARPLAILAQMTNDEAAMAQACKRRDMIQCAVAFMPVEPLISGCALAIGIGRTEVEEDFIHSGDDGHSPTPTAPARRQNQAVWWPRPIAREPNRAGPALGIAAYQASQPGKRS